MGRNKNQGLKWIAGIAIVLAVIAISFQAFSVSNQQGQSEQLAEVIGSSNTAEFCANNAKLDLKVRVFDKLANSASSGYLNNTVLLLKDLSSGSVETLTITGGSSSGGYTTFSNQVVCGQEAGYEMQIRTDQDLHNALLRGKVEGGDYQLGKVIISQADLEEEDVTVDLETTQHSLLKLKAKDRDNDAFMFNQTHTVQNFVEMTASGLNISFNNGTSKAIGAGEGIDVEFTFAPNTSNRAGGSKALAAIDVGGEGQTDDWDENTLIFQWNGVTPEQADLNAEDAIALSGYQIFYEVSPIGMTVDEKGVAKRVNEAEARFAIDADPSTNPDSSPRLRYVEKGAYISDDDPNAILEDVGFRVDSGRTAIGSATASVITVAIV